MSADQNEYHGGFPRHHSKALHAVLRKVNDRGTGGGVAEGGNPRTDAVAAHVDGDTRLVDGLVLLTRVLRNALVVHVQVHAEGVASPAGTRDLDGAVQDAEVCRKGGWEVGWGGEMGWVFFVSVGFFWGFFGFFLKVCVCSLS